MSKKRQTRKTGPSGNRQTMAANAPGRLYWPYFLGAFLSLVAAFWAYGPALSGPFIFDDRYLPFGTPSFPVDSFSAWLKGVRPVLMLSYWVNFQLSQFQPYSYHAFNVVFHTANAVLMFFAVRKVLEFAGVESQKRDALAAFAGLLFLLHPVNSESVSYVASRSENLSVLFFLGAFTVFLYQGAWGVTWTRAVLVLALFGAAAITKEHTIILPALLILTDYFWNPPFSIAGIRRNWKLYAPTAIGGVLVALYLSRTLRGAETAGFGVKDFTWYQYFFTQCRAFWVYVRLFVFPIGLHIDYDFP